MQTADIRMCSFAHACGGGTDASDYCLDNHSGPYCSLCKPGFYLDPHDDCQVRRSLVRRRAHPPPRSPAAHTGRTSLTHTTDTALGRSIDPPIRARACPLAPSAAQVCDQSALSYSLAVICTAFGSALLAFGLVMYALESKRISRALVSSTKVTGRTILSFVQVVLLIDKSYGVKLPSNFLAFLAHFRFFSFDRFYVYGFSCYGASYHTSLVRADVGCRVLRVKLACPCPRRIIIIVLTTLLRNAPPSAMSRVRWCSRSSRLWPLALRLSTASSGTSVVSASLRAGAEGGSAWRTVAQLAMALGVLLLSRSRGGRHSRPCCSSPTL